MSFLTDVQGIDLPVEERQSLPRIWWHNGAKGAAQPGHFYTKINQFTDPLGAPWEAAEKYENEKGAIAYQLKIAIIAWRQQPFIMDKVSKVTTWLDDYEPGATFLTELLCFVEGLPGLIQWNAKGLTGKAVTGKGGIISQYRTQLLDAAEQTAGKPLPLWTFFLPIATAKDSQGRVIYQDTGHSSVVTLPVLSPKVQPTREIMDRLYVGGDLLVQGVNVRQEYAAWLKQRRGKGTGAAAEQEADGPYDEESMPF